MIKCKNCSAMVKDGAAFCTQCGAPIYNPIKAEDISEDDFFNIDMDEEDGEETTSETTFSDDFDLLSDLLDTSSEETAITERLDKPDNPTEELSTVSSTDKPVEEHPTRRRRRQRSIDTSETVNKEKNRKDTIKKSSDSPRKKLTESKSIADGVKEYADETASRNEYARSRSSETSTAMLDDGRKRVAEKKTRKRKRERNYNEIDIYKLEQDLSKIKESDYDGYYEDILPIDHDRDMSHKLPAKTLLQAAGIIIGFALVIYLIIIFMF